MIKSILVCTDGSDFGDRACEYAIHLAQRLHARLRGLHVLDSRMLEGPLLADIGGWIGADPYRGLQGQFRDLMQKKGESVAEAFRDLCRKHNLAAECSVKTGHPARVILEEEALAELVVMGQQGEHAGWLEGMTGSVIERVVRHSVKPCLITPTEFRPLRRLLAAYDGSAVSGKALHEAIELAQALATELVVLTVVDSAHPEKAGPVSAEAGRLAQDHGLTAQLAVEGGNPIDVILGTTEQRQCDLLVVGAYGHSRIREMILGSTTTALMTRARIPLMLVR